MPRGRAGLNKDIPGTLERVSERLPTMAVDSLRDHRARVLRTDEETAAIEHGLGLWYRSNEASWRIAEIPGVGVLSATATVATMDDPKAFCSGREFAAWLTTAAYWHRRKGAGARH